MDWLKRIWNKINRTIDYIDGKGPFWSEKFEDKVLSQPNMVEKLNRHLDNNQGDPLFKLKNDETGEEITFRKVGYRTDEEIKDETRKKKLKKIDKNLK